MRNAGSVTAIMVLAHSARAFRAVVSTGVPRRAAGGFGRTRVSSARATPALFCAARPATTLRAGADGDAEEENPKPEANAGKGDKAGTVKIERVGGADEDVDDDLEAGDEDLAIPPYMQYEIEQEGNRRLQEEAELKVKMEMGGGVRRTNPLLQQKGLPKFETITPETAKPALEILLEDLEEGFAKMEDDLINYTRGEAWGRQRMRHNYAGVVERQERLTDPVSYAWGVLTHLTGVKNSDPLREVYQELQPKVVTAFQKLGQSKVVYEALKFLQLPSSTRLMTEAQIRVVDKAVKGMELGGVGLEGEAKEEFNKIQLELAELGTKFSNNVLDATKAFSFTLADQADVEGLPESALALAAQSAKAAGAEDATPETGPWRLSLDMPSYLPSMQHLKNRSVREKLYRAFTTRASGFSPAPEGEEKSIDNEPVLSRVLELKKKMAGLLGYGSYAEISLSKKMAGSVEAVEQLTSMLREKSYPAAERELEELKAYAKENGHEGDLELWDTTYWGERRKEELYAFSEEELRPYFALPKVLEGMFGLAGRLFGVSIKPANGDTEVWHPDVTFFKITDASSGEHVASFFLDPYSRPENKRGGAWMDVCVGRSQALGRKTPVAYLTCNGSPPVGDTTPSLMTFREVETLFHEFGHGLQHMLTKMVDGECAGINGVEWDAVELPSQFMENWCYDKPTVDQFARHYETGEPLPADLFDKLCAQRTYMAGSGMLRQLYFGQLDMELHHRFDPTSKAESVFDVQRRVAEQFTVMPPLPEDRFLCGFSHIFAGGYAAGYYSYKYAEVMSADAFAAFEEAGLDNEQAVSSVGMRFKDTVLAMGGGRHPAKVFRDFRGRDPNPEALLRHCGLSEGSPTAEPQRELAGAGRP